MNELKKQDLESAGLRSLLESIEARLARLEVGQHQYERRTLDFLDSIQQDVTLLLDVVSDPVEEGEEDQLEAAPRRGRDRSLSPVRTRKRTGIRSPVGRRVLSDDDLVPASAFEK